MTASLLLYTPAFSPQFDHAVLFAWQNIYTFVSTRVKVFFVHTQLAIFQIITFPAAYGQRQSTPLDEPFVSIWGYLCPLLRTRSPTPGFESRTLSFSAAYRLSDTQTQRISILLQFSFQQADDKDLNLWQLQRWYVLNNYQLSLTIAKIIGKHRP